MVSHRPRLEPAVQTALNLAPESRPERVEPQALRSSRYRRKLPPLSPGDGIGSHVDPVSDQVGCERAGTARHAAKKSGTAEAPLWPSVSLRDGGLSAFWGAENWRVPNVRRGTSGGRSVRFPRPTPAAVAVPDSPFCVQTSALPFPGGGDMLDADLADLAQCPAVSSCPTISSHP